MLPDPNTPSFDTVAAAYAKAIQKKIRHFVYDNAIANDLHQEVLIKLWRKIDTYDATKGSLYSWIIKITANTCIDHLRAVRRTVITTYRTGLDIEETGIASPDYCAHRALLRLMHNLSGSQKDIVLLIYFRGHTQNEVARLLKLPLGTVKTRQRSAILALRKMCCAGQSF